MKNLLVTGAAGFIGSCFAIQEINKGNKVIALDVGSYSSHMGNLAEISSHENFEFIKGDICNSDLVQKLLHEFEIENIIHFAAESHVDNSIQGPEVFIKTNVLGTYTLLWESLKYWQNKSKPEVFRFLHVSTDEVFGELALMGRDKFDENSPYSPNSPYSASKAASDHLVRAWHHTYGLPAIITNCSNNYGPRQHHEKLIPHMIKCALSDQPLPVYGTGANVRDWIYVEDHTKGIALALEHGKTGESYCFGGNCELNNLDLVNRITKTLDQLCPRRDGASYTSQITFVEDRPGHDLRYAIDDSKARRDLNYDSTMDFNKCLKDTIAWYLENNDRIA